MIETLDLDNDGFITYSEYYSSHTPEHEVDDNDAKIELWNQKGNKLK